MWSENLRSLARLHARRRGPWEVIWAGHLAKFGLQGVQHLAQSSITNHAVVALCRRHGDQARNELVPKIASRRKSKRW